MDENFYICVFNKCFDMLKILINICIKEMVLINCLGFFMFIMLGFEIL